MAKTRFRLALEATIYADNAQEAIADFEDRITKPPFIRNGENGKRFNVTMRIKHLPYDDSQE